MSSDERRIELLAHEVRSPVAALEALATGARGVSGAGLSRVVELALAAGHDIERLLSDPDALSLLLEEVDLVALLDSLARPGVTCNAEPVRLVCDPTRIRQALGNLVANGRRHGTAVTVTGRRRDEWIVIEVRDNGPGIDPAVDVFERGVSGVGSSGYGLWLARAIAEAHGGSLALEPTPLEPTSGSGATFSFAVPSRPSANG